MKTNIFSICILASFLLQGCGSDSGTGTEADSSSDSDGDLVTYGDVYSGEFHLGPVDWSESVWYNSCAPYPKSIQQLEGEMLAGLELTHNGEGQLCDACVSITTEAGKTLVVRVITTGVTTENSIDLSEPAFEILDSGEYPRAMSWQVVKCPNTGHIYYQFQTGANEWWTSLWVRNIRIPIQKVEVKSQNHNDWHALTLGSDGTFTDASGFGAGSFTIRVTSIDGQTVEDTFSAFNPGDLLESISQFE